MSDMTVAAGRRSRWGLFIAPVILLILAVAWSCFWFYAASQNESKTPFTARLDNILVVAQVYDPKLVIAEFSAPATLTDSVTQNTFVVNWSKGRSSVVGLPAVPDRASLVFDDPSLNRLDGSVQVPLARAKQIELHGRLADGSPADHPVIETVLHVAQGSIQGVHPLLAEPFEADTRAKVTGLSDLTPKP